MMKKNPVKTENIRPSNSFKYQRLLQRPHFESRQPVNETRIQRSHLDWPYLVAKVLSNNT